MFIGDLVRYACQLTGDTRIGLITDVIEDANGFEMYEVICTDPYDRGWYSDLSLEAIGKKSSQRKSQDSGIH